MTKYISSDEEFINAVKSSINIHQVLMKLCYKSKRGSYISIMKRCKKLHLDISHFTSEKVIKQKILDQEIIDACKAFYDRKSVLNKFRLTDKIFNITWLCRQVERLEINTDHWLIDKVNIQNISKQSLDDCLIKYGSSNSCQLKSRLIRTGYFENRCYTPNCIGNEWHGKPLSLHLEHINGDHCDNRLENLTLLCPNCHSQTATYSRAKSSFVEKEIKHCIDCDCQIGLKSFRCRKCSMLYNKANVKTKIVWPTDGELLQMLKISNFVQVGKKLGVSDNAIRKRMQKRNLSLADYYNDHVI